MRSSPSQVRLLVMVLVAWCALSAAPVVANSPSLPAAFFVIAVGLVAAVTLRFSTLVGLAMAVLGTALFAISVVLDPASGASRSGVQGLAGVLSRLDQLLPALVAAVSLVGTAVCASLASWEIDGRPGAILEPVGTEEESEGELEQHASVVEPATGSRGAVTAGVMANFGIVNLTGAGVTALSTDAKPWVRSRSMSEPNDEPVGRTTLNANRPPT